MSRPIHELFERHPQEPAEAFSELFYRMSDLKFLSTGGDPSNPNFPPKPAYITAVLAAYREDDDQPIGDLRRQMHIASAPHITQPEVARVLIDNYSEIVKPWQDALNVPGMTKAVTESVAAAVEQKAVEYSLRTVGMFVLASAPDGEHFAGLAIPKNAYVDLPLEQRDTIMGMMRDFDRAGVDVFSLLGDRAKELFQSVARNDPSQAEPLFYAIAAVCMPRYEQLRASLAQML